MDALQRQSRAHHFRQQDKDAARDFLLRIKALFPLITLPEAWDEDEGIDQFQQLSGLFPLRLYWLTGLVPPAVIFRVLRKNAC